MRKSQLVRVRDTTLYSYEYETSIYTNNLRSHGTYRTFYESEYEYEYESTKHARRNTRTRTTAKMALYEHHTGSRESLAA
eukprot:scaffold297805_cov41-Prasinocladus_malaysianus.AAC.1